MTRPRVPAARSRRRSSRARPLVLAAALAVPIVVLAELCFGAAAGTSGSARPVNRETWVDHDARPVPAPAERDPGYYGHLFREAFVEQVSRAFDIPDKILWMLGPFGVNGKHQAVNVNVFDEVPNSTWFTNRNHVRALSTAAVRDGPGGAVRPAPPYEIKSVKRTGFNPGFNVKDANDRRWVVKLDPPGHPQLGSGAGVVTSRLVWAAGYNVSHDEAFTFRRQDLTLDEDVVKGADGDPPFSEKDLDELLTYGARSGDGRYYAAASLFLEGTPAGPFSFRGTRDDDPNDWYAHQNRRELRALYVVYGWLNNWDVKDHQSLDMFHAPKGAKRGYVRHNLLDMNASLGAAGQGPKDIQRGYEQTFDLGWIMKRIVTLGFIEEPWRRARQKTGIPSVGNFESEVFESAEWRPSQYVQPLRDMTHADGYWGAKLVASFSDEQIAAAIDAAGYEDPRARAYLLQALTERRDKVARYWFGVVAPLDYFHIRDGALRFHDLAVDRGLESPRAYEVAITSDGSHPSSRRTLRATSLPLPGLGNGASALTLTFTVPGSGAKPVTVELARREGQWAIARVRHT